MMPLVWGKNKQGKRDETGGVLILLLAVLAFHGLMSAARGGSSPPPASPCGNPVVIQVEGEVPSPGVYTFCMKSDLQTLLKRAGGPKSLLRRAPRQTVPSGSKVLIQTNGTGYRFSVTEMSAFSKMTLGLSISLNGEDEEGLTALPGIGPATARAIVQERDRRGGFKDLHELKAVEGVGDKLLEKISPFVIL